MLEVAPIASPLDLMQGPRLEPGARREKALQEMERLLLSVMLKEMRKTVEDGGLYGSSPARKLFQEMMDDVFAEKMAESGQLGIANAIGQQIDLQENQATVRSAIREQGTNPVPLPFAPPPGSLDFPQLTGTKELIGLKPAPISADTLGRGAR